MPLAADQAIRAGLLAHESFESILQRTRSTSRSKFATW